MEMKTLTPLITLDSLNPQVWDTVQMVPGDYAGLDLTGLNGIKFIPAGPGQINFTKNIKVGGSFGISFDGRGYQGYGFKYSGNDFQVFDLGKGNVQSLTVFGFDFGNTAYTVFDAQTKIYSSKDVLLTYNGNIDTFVLYNLVVENCKISGKTSMLIGTFEDVTTYHMVCRYLIFNNIVCINDGSGESVKISGQSIYDLGLDHWIVTGPTLSKNDVGIVFITGNVIITNSYRNGGYGYWLRLINAFLSPLTSSAIKNCIDVNSTKYGTADVRVNPKYVNKKAVIPIYAGNFYFTHNTVGDKKDDGSYVTDAVVLGDMLDEDGISSTVVIKDNIAWNAMPSTQANGSSLLKNNSKTIVVSSNNIDLPPGVPLPNGYFTDMVNFIPADKSPLIGAASDGTDIGAIQSLKTVPVQNKQRTVVKIEHLVTYDDGSTQIL